MIRSFSFFIINVLLLVTFTGCTNDPLKVDISDIDLEVKVQRFDREVFTLDFDSVNNAISDFYSEYDDFFDVYNVHVINIGPASQKYYGSYLSMFVNDPLNYEVFEYTQDVFPGMIEIEAELTSAFKHYLYHFPDFHVPQIVGYVSRFNQKLFTVGNFIGLGLDQYLGRDCAYYNMLRTPEYIQYNMYPEKIPSDIVNVWGSALFPYNDSVDNVLGRMIYNGQLLYFSDMLLPEMSDSIKIGFSPSQMKFCKNNEEQMWTYLIEHKLLFSSEQLVIRKLTDDAPTTQYFPAESPGKAANWLGWQIVREYARRNPNILPADILSERNYQTILSGSKYDP
ncbi:MAG: hypothetical protein PF450_13180 [Bacteroidales bacterium]|jgi:hypothetical protein|nr:hypothetical protein [Bacteroidales bacterium]